jgi:hypothetical protein
MEAVSAPPNFSLSAGFCPASSSRLRSTSRSRSLSTILTGSAAETGHSQQGCFASVAVPQSAGLQQVGERAGSEHGYWPLSRGQAGHRLDTNLSDLGGPKGTGGRVSGKSPDHGDPDGRNGLHGRASGA